MIDELTHKLGEEKARITQARLVAWSSVGHADEIAGVAVKPLTARAWIDLRLAKNALFTGDDVTVNDLLNYIWRNSTEYLIGGDVKQRKEAIKKAVESKDALEVYGDATEHLNAAFETLAIEQSTGGSGVSRSNKFPATEGIVSAIDEVAHRYGQAPQSVLDWPLCQILQLQTAIRIATLPEYKTLEPESVRSIKREILIQLNNNGQS